MHENCLLKIEKLNIAFPYGENREKKVVRDLSLSLRKGKILALVGESGCGKTVLVKSIMGLLKDEAVLSGSISLKDCDLTSLSPSEMENVRIKQLSMVFQDPLSSLNPSMSIGDQIEEAVALRHPDWSKTMRYEKVIELMELVGIEEASVRNRLYPYHFSGGMRQRCVLAIALASEPEILLLDEPTTALDVSTQARILALLKTLKTKLTMSMLFVTHDLGVVANLADDIAVMYAGEIVEYGPVSEIFHAPAHPYTRSLLKSLPYYSTKTNDAQLFHIGGTPPVIFEEPQEDLFSRRSPYPLLIEREEKPPVYSVSENHWVRSFWADERAPEISSYFPFEVGKPGPIPPNIEEEAVLSHRLDHHEYREGHHHHPASYPEHHHHHEHPHQDHRHYDDFTQLSHVSVSFSIGRGRRFKALDNVSFGIRPNEIFGIVGESGSGKSTAAKVLMNLIEADSGSVWFEGIDTTSRKQFRQHQAYLKTNRAMIFQDAKASLDPRWTIEKSLMEALSATKLTKQEKKDRIASMLFDVGLDTSVLSLYPSELSGGMLSRISIARALLTRPKLLVADEPISSLDVSVQAQIVNLFKMLQKKYQFSLVFIAHDLSMVSWLCDRVMVLYKGRVVEIAQAERLLKMPLHPYTKSLVDAIALPDPNQKLREAAMGERKDFQLGEMIEISPGHFVRMEEEIHEP